MSATHAGSTSGANLCHLLVRRARNVAMSKSVAPLAVIRWSFHAHSFCRPAPRSGVSILPAVEDRVAVTIGPQPAQFRSLRMLQAGDGAAG